MSNKIPRYEKNKEKNKFLIKTSQLSVVINNKIILDNINFEISPKQIITLIGPNGAGKSTFIRALLGLQAIQNGEIHRKTNLRTGYVPQQLLLNPLIPISVHHFLQLCPNYQTHRTKQLLEQFKMTNFTTTDMRELSGGERQRILLIRALLNQPELLILDEPNQGLDWSGQLNFYQLLPEIAETESCGILMVSHDLHFVMAETHQVICLNQHICCAGSPQKISQDPNFINLFGMQATEKLAWYAHAHFHDHHLDGSISITPSKAT